MWHTVRALMLTLCISVCAPAQSRFLELYLKPAPGLDPHSSFMMRQELQRLLTPAGIRVVWKNPGEVRSGEDFDLIAVSSFEGTCSAMDAVRAPRNEKNPALTLAGTSISNGRVLPFFTVDCKKVLQLMRSELERLDSGSRQLLLGRALGRVMAHEIYHIVANTPSHSSTGAAKAYFSIRDLTATQFGFDESGLEGMRPEKIVRVSTLGK
jgi:hypothetical protein